MLPLTLQELQDRLKRFDEITLLELLDVTSEELVEAFADRIDDNYDRLVAEVEYDGEEETDE